MTPEQLAAISALAAWDDPCGQDVIEDRGGGDRTWHSCYLGIGHEGPHYWEPPELTEHLRVMIAEVRRLNARNAELEEAARWRKPSDKPPHGHRVEVGLTPVGWRSCGAYAGDGIWVVSGQDLLADADILGWRPLGPGPEASK